MAINARFLTRPATGVDRFARELLTVIDRWIGADAPEVAGFSFRMLAPSTARQGGEWPNIPLVSAGRLTGQSWEQWDLPRALEAKQWLLSLCNTAPISPSRQIVAIHDAATAAMPSAFTVGFRTWYRFLMPMLERRARAVVTVSEFSRRELVRWFGFRDSKIAVVSEGGEHILRCEPDATVLGRFGLGRRPYVLAVSSAAPHKNFKVVLEALGKMGSPRFDVAIAGGTNARVFADHAVSQSKEVKWLGYVTDNELRALYEGAVCFVFPSLYEGFGIPPLEAMHCGCPVIASRAASIPEVCGDAALYFDGSSAEELALALERVTSDSELRSELRSRGFARARRFSWETAARQLIELLRRIVKGEP